MPLSQDIAETTWLARTQESRLSLKAIWIGYGTGIPPGLSVVIRTDTCTCTCTLERKHGLYHGR